MSADAVTQLRKKMELVQCEPGASVDTFEHDSLFDREPVTLFQSRGDVITCTKTRHKTGCSVLTSGLVAVVLRWILEVRLILHYNSQVY